METSLRNTGKIIKPKLTDNYTVIPNEIIKFKVLSFDSSAILMYLLSLPSDWSIYKSNIEKDINIGETRFNRAWKELNKKGYITMTIRNSSIGRLYDYVVTSNPNKN